MDMELIVACNENGLIGDGKTIPWHVPEDLKRFKELTTNHILVMGRKTYDSLPGSCPLPNRIHIVISHVVEPIINEDNTVYITHYYDAMNILRKLHNCHPYKRVYIIGGSQIYKLFFDQCSKFHITVISSNTSQYIDTVEKSQGVDKSPDVDKSENVFFENWKDITSNSELFPLVYQSDIYQSRNKQYSYQYFTYDRRNTI